VKVRTRNEAFDLRVYNTAGLEMLSIDLKSERRRLLRLAEKRDNPPKKVVKSRKPKGSSWAEGWKDG
jgi:phage terminase large subunit GpA-like protein